MQTLALRSILGLVSLGIAAAAAGPHVSVDKNGVILNGYDAVAYFTEHKAVKGTSEFTATHDGAVYHFSSAAHRDLFIQEPQKYAPQYGGWCAYAASLGKKSPVNGKAFEIVDGKLYVNYDSSVHKKWTRHRDDNIRDADQKWPDIKDVPADKL